MAVGISPTAIKLSIIGSLLSSLDLTTAQAPLKYEKEYDLTSGTGANQAQEIFSDTRTIAASSSENLDLAGSLTDVFGGTITFTKIKALIIKASPGNTNDVLVGGAASNPVVSLFGDAYTAVLDPPVAAGSLSIVRVKPGGLFVLIAPDVNGYGVVAGTGDLLTVANSGGTTGVTYDIIVIGV